jgi:hypothetical protein
VRRVVLTLVALAVAVGGPLLALTAGGGADDRGGAPAAFAWEGEPQAIAPEAQAAAREDHIVLGRLRNTSLRTAELDVERVRVLDADGRALKTSVRFLHNFAHGIYSHEMVFRDGTPPSAERRRLGEIATVRPGASVPFTVSWRGRGAVAVDLGGATVPLPTQS